jgi:hypothetical protein
MPLPLKPLDAIKSVLALRRAPPMEAAGYLCGETVSIQTTQDRRDRLMKAFQMLQCEFPQAAPSPDKMVSR